MDTQYSWISVLLKGMGGEERRGWHYWSGILLQLQKGVGNVAGILI